MKPKPVIEVKHVSFGYTKKLVVQDANLTVHQNDYIAVIGPNGGGKTTLMKLILGLLDPQKGKITVFGDAPKINQHLIGYVPQQVHFDFEFPMQVLDVVLMGRLGRGRLFQRYSKEDRVIALEMLKQVGLEDLASRQIHSLSGGQRQRVLIARALASDPQVLILDEPTAGVDAKWQKELHALLKKLNEEIAILIISHHLEIICDHVQKVLFVNEDVHLHESLEEAVKHIGEVYGFHGDVTLKHICR